MLFKKKINYEICNCFFLSVAFTIPARQNIFGNYLPYTANNNYRVASRFYMGRYIFKQNVCRQKDKKGYICYGKKVKFNKKSYPIFRIAIRLLQRGRDSNPRCPFGAYTLSRRAPSTTRPPL